MNPFLKLVTGIFALCIIILAVFPPQLSNKHLKPRLHLISNMKQIGTGLSIYSVDYDGRLPNCLTNSEFKYLSNIYVKNPALYERVDNDYNDRGVDFNYNLAGVQIDLPEGIPLRDKQNFMSPSEAVMLYSIITRKGEPPAILTYADTSTRPLPKQAPFNPVLIFGPQFDRGNTKLQGEDQTK